MVRGERDVLWKLTYLGKTISVQVRMPPDHMTSPPMRFENGLETLPPLPPPRAARTRTAVADVVNSDTYDADLKLVDRLVLSSKRGKWESVPKTIR